MTEQIRYSKQANFNENCTCKCNLPLTV